ncbi:MAG: hypothetical protein HY769_06665 [Candidatus Stahlbacteria bacterium]|nr:hypothetical protein [Candidatus Stahlbacteria bacterium]
MDKILPVLPVINTGTVIVTAGIILWYTIETYRLRRQSVLQTEIQIRPLLIIILKEDFTIKNIGNGIALNVEIEDIVIDMNEPHKFSFDKINAISQNEEIGLPRVRVFKDDQKVPADSFQLLPFVVGLYPRYASRNYEFRLRYENINGEKYQSIVITGKDGVHIKEICKVGF